MTMADVDPLRIEEAGLNALQTQHQLFYDGWLLRLSAGKAKRARSVNPHFGSTLPLSGKIDRCEAIYATRGLPALFRMTPFCQPPGLERELERRGYIVFDPTLVQAVRLADVPAHACAPGIAGAAADRDRAGVEITAPPIAEFVGVAGELRGSPPAQRAAQLERLAHTPLAMRAVVARIDGAAVACGQAAIDGDLAGIYDMATAAAFRGRGVATALVHALLAWARGEGASHAFLQVNADNDPALHLYTKFGFTTVYTYHYRARPHECR